MSRVRMVTSRFLPVPCRHHYCLQVELRVMAALSADEPLLQAFAHGQDVHASTAREVLAKQPEVCAMMLPVLSLVLARVLALLIAVTAAVLVYSSSHSPSAFVPSLYA